VLSNWFAQPLCFVYSLSSYAHLATPSRCGSSCGNKLSMRSGSTLTSTADAVWLPARDVPSKPPTLKQKARPAIELLTTAEAAWQVRVLILAATAYVFIIILVRYSPGVLLLTVLFLAAMVAALMFSVDRQTNRANALENLRSAFASGDAGRIRAAIWHARAAGVSAEEVASTKELRAAVSGKLRQALADQDVERLSTAVRCAQAAAISPEDAGEPLTAALSILNNAVPRTRPDIERSSSTSSSTSSCVSGSASGGKRCGADVSVGACGGSGMDSRSSSISRSSSSRDGSIQGRQRLQGQKRQQPVLRQQGLRQQPGLEDQRAAAAARATPCAAPRADATPVGVQEVPPAATCSTSTDAECRSPKAEADRLCAAIESAIASTICTKGGTHARPLL